MEKAVGVLPHGLFGFCTYDVCEDDSGLFPSEKLGAPFSFKKMLIFSRFFE